MEIQFYISNMRAILRLKLEKFLAFGLRMDDFPDISPNVIIYGAGETGKLLLRCFEKPPVGFMDQKELHDIGGIPVYHPNHSFFDTVGGNCTVIVTPIWDFELIKDELMNNKKLTVISLETLLEGL